MKNRFVLLLLAFLILMSACGMASALKETQLSTNKADQTQPCLYDKYIVWTDTRNGGTDIYLTDLKTKVQTRVTKSGKASCPSVDYGKIVYADDRNGNSDIYMYDIKTKKETRITTNKAGQFYPSIYGNRIVWEDRRNPNLEIYMYDLSTKKETRLTPGKYSLAPSIFRDKVVWIDRSKESAFDNVVVYDLKTKKKISIPDVMNSSRPIISGNRVIVNDYYSDGKTLLYDFSTNKFIGLPFEYVSDPAFYGNQIVYTDYRNGNADIFMTQI